MATNVSVESVINSTPRFVSGSFTTAATANSVVTLPAGILTANSTIVLSVGSIIAPPSLTQFTVSGYNSVAVNINYTIIG